MGFFSGITKALTGGSDSSSSSKSGFALLPSEIQDVYKDFATQLGKYTLPSASGVLDSFLPLDMLGEEQQALDIVGGGLAPTEESLRSDVQMQMNPFDDYVIDDINREAQGDYSILKQALDETGQFGSNRQTLGASDIEQKRLGQIGRFRQDQYNRAVDNSLGQIAGLKQQDIANLFGAGDFRRELDRLTKQAPIEALKTSAGLLSALPESGGSQGVSKSSSVGGFSSFFG